MDQLWSSIQNPTFVMFNAGLAGLYNLIPGVRELYTGSYHGSHDGYEAMSVPQEYLDSVRASAMAYGWW